MVRVDGWRPTQGGWLRLALREVAGLGGVKSVDIRASATAPSAAPTASDPVPTFTTASDPRFDDVQAPVDQAAKPTITAPRATANATTTKPNKPTVADPSDVPTITPTLTSSTFEVHPDAEPVEEEVPSVPQPASAASTQQPLSSKGMATSEEAAGAGTGASTATPGTGTASSTASTAAKPSSTSTFSSVSASTASNKTKARSRALLSSSSSKAAAVAEELVSAKPTPGPWLPLSNTYGAVWERSGLPSPSPYGYDLRVTNAQGQQLVLRWVLV